VTTGLLWLDCYKGVDCTSALPECMLQEIIIPPKAKGGVSKFCIGIGSGIRCASVTSFSFRTSEARGLKLGMHNSHIDGSKAINQIFDILLRS